MEALPVEIKQEIFKHSDLDSVPSLALSCRKLYCAYKEAQGLILWDMTAKAIGPRLLQLALARREAANAGWKQTGAHEETSPKLIAAVEHFGATWLRRDTLDLPISVTPPSFEFKVAQDMISFHSLVKHHAEEFISIPIFIPWGPGDLFGAPEMDPDVVMKTFYMMEILREILPFMNREPHGPDEKVPWRIIWTFLTLDDEARAEYIAGKYLNMLLPRHITAAVDNKFPEFLFPGGTFEHYLFSKFGLRGLDRFIHCFDVQLILAEIMKIHEELRQKPYRFSQQRIP